MPREPRKTRARELALVAIPLTVTSFAWYMIPSRYVALWWTVCGAIILAYAAYLWWAPETEGP